MIVFRGQEHKTVSDLLHSVSIPIVDPDDKAYPYDSPESREYYDMILTHIHDPTIFEGLPFITNSNRLAYILYDEPLSKPVYVCKEDITDNYFVRCLFAFTQPRFRQTKLLALLALSGGYVSSQVLCLASSFPSFVSDDGHWSNWFKLILQRGYPVVKNGALITDNFGNSIFSIIHRDSLKYLLRVLVAEKFLVPVIKKCNSIRFKKYAETDPELKGLLDRMTFNVI